MKTHLANLGLAALALISLNAAAERVARAYDISNITEVVVANASQVQLVQGNSDSLRVEGEPEALEHVKIDQDGQRLTLSMKSRGDYEFGLGSLFRKNTPTFYLQLKNLESLDLGGASHGIINQWAGKALKIHAGGASSLELANLKFETLQMRLDGASEMSLQGMSATTAEIYLSGASDAKATGQSQFLLVDASGASNYHGKSLKAQRAELKASGASDIDAHVVDQLKADASGASDINYRGQPKVQMNTSGASDVTAI
jgi:hypothetical protein